MKAIIFLGATFASLVATAGAWAAGSGEGPNIEQQVSGQQEGASNTLGQLPFTGVDLALIVGAGLLLIVAGLTMRRASASRAKTKA